MTQPRKPSGPGEWREGDWLVCDNPHVIAHVRGRAYRLGGFTKAAFRSGNDIVIEGDTLSTWSGIFRWLARPADPNDPEGWVAHDGGPNPAPGMRVACKWRDPDYWRGGDMVSGTWSWDHTGRGSDIILWCPSLERPVTGEGEPGWLSKSLDDARAQIARDPERHAAIARNLGLATPDTPRPAEGDGLEVADDQLPLDMALKLLSDATDMAVYAGAGSANVAWTCRAAAATLEAANRRIAELEGALSEANANGAAHWSRALKAEARCASAVKVIRWYADDLRNGASARAFLQQGVKP